MNDQKIQIPTELLKCFSPMELLSENHLDEIVKKADVLSFGPKKMIFKRGNIEDYVYFLLQGKIDLCDEHFNIRHLAADTPATRTALDSECPFQFSCVSTTAGKALKINRDHLDLVLTWSQAGDYLVEDLDEEQTQAGGQDWMSLLLQSNLMHKVPPGHIQQLFSAFAPKHATSGELIIKEGEPGDNFYVLEEGQALVTRQNEDGNTVTLAQLNPGDFFGEEALISDAARNATITMITQGRLMVLDKESFARLLKDPVLKYMDRDELDAQLNREEDLLILDIRTDSEAKGNEEPHTLNIPLASLRSKLKSLDEETTYVVHDNGGRRSELAAYLLNEAGLNALVLQNNKKKAL